jgi:hypothetical protein
MTKVLDQDPATIPADYVLSETNYFDATDF